ncbi:hypothetical protein OSB04_011671 [Centaurea solstitialis]|uniref:Reverse transcriptase Ty1/copia-type domain-containing protein n=1 Tax=Centaurea solstitialis TaxID=347529 RepID=A0AA38WDW6_9ASTR|nr:hypothetical protein OSB04_011671 [Centaurea solstitialis]
MLKSTKILIVITAFHDYEIWQMDVKTTFLNGKLSEDVYMTQPGGFLQSKHPNRLLGKCFSMKDMGDTTYILGIKIYRDRSRRLIGLSQSTYIDKVLKKFNMQDSKKGFILMQHERMSRILYASAIGSIMYAMIRTRSDVSCALSMTSRYQG